MTCAIYKNSSSHARVFPIRYIDFLKQQNFVVVVERISTQVQCVYLNDVLNRGLSYYQSTVLDTLVQPVMTPYSDRMCIEFCR
jgi:hypothetical protein